MNVAELRDKISCLPLNFEIKFQVRRQISEEGLAGIDYPYPFETENVEIEFDDIGWSDQVVLFGGEIKKL